MTDKTADKTFTLYVATHTSVERFYRCGMEFTRDWKKVEVDEATGRRLAEEQMLRVQPEPPADYVETGAEASDDAADTGTGKATTASTAKTTQKASK